MYRLDIILAHRAPKPSESGSSIEHDLVRSFVCPRGILSAACRKTSVQSTATAVDRTSPEFRPDGVVVFDRFADGASRNEKKKSKTNEIEKEYPMYGILYVGLCATKDKKRKKSTRANGKFGRTIFEWVRTQPLEYNTNARFH